MVGEREVAEVVGAELHLEPVGRTQQGQGHHTGVVDQEVEPAVGLLRDVAGGIGHGGQVRQVEADEAYVRARGGTADGVLRAPAPPGVTAGEDRPGPGAGQGERRHGSDPAVGARDHRGGAEEVGHVVERP